MYGGYIIHKFWQLTTMVATAILLLIHYADEISQCHYWCIKRLTNGVTSYEEEGKRLILRQEQNLGGVVYLQPLEWIV